MRPGRHAVVGKLGSRPVLIGHSTGCWVVLNYLAMQAGWQAVAERIDSWLTTQGL
jgi:pimeloyl-ACP methyl ester carboxylesterase